MAWDRIRSMRHRMWLQGKTHRASGLKYPYWKEHAFIDDYLDGFHGRIFSEIQLTTFQKFWKALMRIFK